MCIPLLIASILRSARYNLARYLTSKCEVYLLLESVHARNANLEQIPEPQSEPRPTPIHLLLNTIIDEKIASQRRNMNQPGD
jgi:rRNA pseudouridine-1189 N-methylase Emg1 (Nep1/Mra1 family)